jgi:hypothetical protein
VRTQSYVIDGMDGMNAEEYQSALREKVIARAQAKRVTGSYGNRAANAYLSFLNTRPSYDDVKDINVNPDDEDFGEY